MTEQHCSYTAVLACINLHVFYIPAGGAVDYGYAPSKIYNYTFHAGSTCAYPDANITITDDMIGEDDETFQIVIIDAALPFNVKAGQPATIIINDNDSKYAKCIAI